MHHDLGPGEACPGVLTGKVAIAVSIVFGLIAALFCYIRYEWIIAAQGYCSILQFVGLGIQWLVLSIIAIFVLLVATING